MKCIRFAGISFAISDYKDIDGRDEMNAKVKLAISPGLVKLLLLELAFLLLAGYIGLSMWVGPSVSGNTPGMEIVLGVILLSNALRTRK